MSDKAEETLHQIIQTNFDNLRDDLQKFITYNDQVVAKEQNDVYSPIIAKLTDELNSYQTQFQQMQTLTQDNTAELTRKENILRKLVEKSALLHTKVRNSNISSRAFHTWIEDGTEKLILTRRFESIFIKKATERVFFRRWIRKMHKRREDRLELEARHIYEKESKESSKRYNAQITKLEEELAAARAELESKQKSFLEMQQRLRKAFMRGVVNLNLEAMDVFNGAQFMNLVQEVEGGTGGVHDSENEVEEGDDEFYVEEAPNVAVIRH